MTAKTDALTPYLTYTSDERKITVATIANDVAGSAMNGVHTREFTAMSRTGGSSYTGGKLNVYIYDPDCSAATVTFDPTSIAKTYYIQDESAATEITIPSKTVSISTCNLLLKTPTINLATPSDATISTATTGKVTYKVSTSAANIGHYKLDLQYTHPDEAATSATNGLIQAPVTISTTACEAADVGTCTATPCLTTFTYQIAAVAAGAKQLAVFTLGAGKTDCKLDYSMVAATSIASSVTFDATTRTATYAQVTDVTKCGIHDSVITAKSIAKEIAQTTTATQRAVFTLADCEADTTGHVTVVSGKATQTIDWELDDADKPTWTKTLDLSGIF